MPRVLWRALLDSTFTGRGRVGGVRNVRLTYMEPHTKLEFDSAIGVTFNAKNLATDYKNGDEFIWDWAVGKKFANGLEVRVASYAYQQLTAEAAVQPLR